MPTVCLVTTGHPSTNPRLVKEADALVGAGFTVRVVSGRSHAWSDTADAEFEGRAWWPPAARVAFGALAAPGARLRQRVRGRLAQAASGRVSLLALDVRALHPAVPELARAAARVPADLYVAHNLAALPAAAHAARRHGARVQFDAEDFHRGELPDTPRTAARRAVIRRVEDAFIPRADAVTAASEGIADAYAEALGIARPTVVLNVFPLADRDACLPPGASADRPDGARTLYWFSQTIGDGRGLEDAVDALALLPTDIHLVVRGTWAAGYEAVLRTRAASVGVADRLCWLPPAPPAEMVARAGLHDVGLALEQPATVNRDLCLTNKAFTYLLAGVPVVATETTGQAPLAAGAPGAVALVPHADARALAAAVARLLADPAAVAAARAAGRLYNWDVEQDRFLDVVLHVLRLARSGKQDPA